MLEAGSEQLHVLGGEGERAADHLGIVASLQAAKLYVLNPLRGPAGALSFNGRNVKEIPIMVIIDRMRLTKKEAHAWNGHQ